MSSNDSNSIIPESFSTYFDDDDLVKEVVLEAENDGDAYRDSKNARQATDRAIRELRRRVREDLDYFFKMKRNEIIREVEESWKIA
jgi:outer membrane protein assembly factor BamE (lipoprotein component of BamABCDE complex)